MRFHPIRTAAVVGAACALGVAGPAMAGDGHGKSEHAKHHAKSGKGKAHKGKTGYVYVATNDPAGNAVVVYRRAADGSLTEAGRYETGGAGGGGRTELPVPITDSQGPIALTRNGRLLFVVNPGSDTVTSFRANGAKLTRVAVVPSNGDVPTAVDAEHHVLYVTNDYTPNMTGYRYDSKGRLTPIAGSTVAFPEGSEPGGVAIDPQGKYLVVTQRGIDGVDRFSLDKHGVPGERRHTDTPDGTNPFGLAISRRDRVVTANAGTAPASFTDSSVSSFGVRGPGAPTPISTVPDGQASSCWVVFNNDERYAFITSPLSGAISAVRVAKDGSLSLVGTDGVVAHADGVPTDEDSSRNGRFLYVLTLDVTLETFTFNQGHILTYRIGRHGTLTQVSSTEADSLPGTASGLQAT